ncbi:hypothetical protein [Streptomyces sp. HNM0574]|uniref:hypothetical protein n=1 Tax=Streptomyces sp. HNM0574 TaxID=2714954 RepID=UPI00146B10A4|nr:hypothetical protein [Streptomyces sp. HNM0574]NLU69364.1 hypothetical protein [Streptomyces sp. HNM0574]
MHRAAPRTKRNAVVAGGIVAVLLPLGLAGPAAAQGLTTAGSPAAVTAPAAAESDVVSSVSGFYDGYITSLGEGDTNRAEKLRQDTVREDYLLKLEQWEDRNGADGVLRSQDVPVGFDVAYDGSGAGHSWTIVTLKWDGGDQPDTKLHVQTDLKTGKISGIKLYE